jgi:hypothetical protein
MSATVRVGDRVRHYGEQFPRARRGGTATVTAVVKVSGGQIEVDVDHDTEGKKRWSADATVLVAKGL